MSVSSSTRFADLMKWSSFSLDDVLGRLNQTHVLNWKINKIAFLLFKIKKFSMIKKITLNVNFRICKCRSFGNCIKYKHVSNKWMFENCDFTWSWFLKCQFSFQNGMNVVIFVEIKMTRQHWRVFNN